MPTPVGAIATESISPRPCQDSECRTRQLRLEGRERALDLVLRASADPAATGERKPVAGVETQPDRGEEQQPAERHRSRARDHQPEQPGDHASQRRPSGMREPAILLATRVVHAPTASSS